MNKQYIFAFGAIFLISSCLVASIAASDDNVDTRALTPVENYLDALVAGDIAGMKSVLSPGLLQKKAPVLNNSSYDDMLTERYKNATFQIVGASSVAAARVKVDTEIILDSGRSMEASFIIVCDADGNCLIDEEVE